MRATISACLRIELPEERAMARVMDERWGEVKCRGTGRYGGAWRTPRPLPCDALDGCSETLGQALYCTPATARMEGHMARTEGVDLIAEDPSQHRRRAWSRRRIRRMRVSATQLGYADTHPLVASSSMLMLRKEAWYGIVHVFLQSPEQLS